MSVGGKIRSGKRRKRARTLAGRLYVIMIAVSVLELAAFLSVFVFGGELSYIKKYAYNTFVENTVNRKTYLENMLLQKSGPVSDTADKVNRIVRDIFEENDLSAADVMTDKELNRRILSETAPSLVSLIRQNQVNDVFIILNSGDLYSTSYNQKNSGIYIRDNDPSQNDMSENEDLLMEMGSADIADQLGIVLDFEWSATLDVTQSTSGQFDFIFNTIAVAEQSERSETYELGQWSGFSRISRSAQQSMKYTVPLTDKDGGVYGVIGIGMTEKLIQSSIPASDSFNGDVCYILAADFENDGVYSPLTHVGAIYSRLVTGDTVIGYGHRIEGDVYDFNFDSQISSLGCIQEMTLYNSASPYRAQKWALVAVGRTGGVMALYYEFLKMFAISAAVSIAISVAGGLIINVRTTFPVKKMINTLNSQLDNTGSDSVSFKSSNISEIDTLGDAIVRLQERVRESSSRVSRIISMVDVGIGVFMYSDSDRSVFISESLARLLEFDELETDSDAVISFELFGKYLTNIDPKGQVCSADIFTCGSDALSHEKTDIELAFRQASGREKWIKFSLTRDKSVVIGLVQDITNVILEKRRIEYERDYDITTGLLNRRAYMNRLNTLFENASELKIAAVIMIDLDNLKYVNDTYGHDFGDDYIRSAATVLRKFSEYGGIVARMSGDEFNVFLYGFDSKEEIRAVIRNVSTALARSTCMLADGTRYRIRASGGVAWYPSDSDLIDRLIKFADFAMYTIKHTTKGNIAEFDKKTYDKDSILMTGVEEMNRIIDEERVKFAFQTIVSAVTGDVYGYEALMRPQSEVLKSPLDLIRLAKSGSKLYEIERLTWLKGLESFRERLDSGLFKRGAKIFINSLSSCIINDTDLSLIEKAYGDMLKDVMLEVLEGEQENEEYMTKKQQIVKRWGAMLGLDDFGSGYNSELSFIRLNPDLIKIDRSIIMSCDSDESKVSIIASLIRMAKSKGCLVLAEGVETSGELKTVIECGVDLIQGYYVSYPQFDPKPVNSAITEEIRQLNLKLSLKLNLK